MRESANAALATSVSQQLVSFDINLDDVTRLAGGARSSLAFVVTTGGTGLLGHVWGHAASALGRPRLVGGPACAARA